MKAVRIITLFMASAAVAAITSCAKEETPAYEQEQISIIQADIVQPTDESATKTSLGEGTGSPISYPVLWKSEDAIAVSNQSASGYVSYTTTADGTQSGTFTTSGEAPSDPVYAYYPADNVTNVSSAVYTVTIPATQSYAENSFGNGAFPMYASATTLESGLTFQPLMSVLKLQLTSTDSKRVRRIVVTSDTENLSGTAQIDMSSGDITWTSGNKSVELDCGQSGVELTGDVKTFHIAVPAGASKNYCVVITTTDAGKGVGKKLTSKTFTVGQIKKMPEVAVTSSTSSTPIYAEGSYMGDGIAITVYGTTTVWAPVNCGYDASHTYGLLYQWGRKYGQGYSGETPAVVATNCTDAFTSHVDMDDTNKDTFYYSTSLKNWYGGSEPDKLWDTTGGSDESHAPAKSSYDPCPNGWRVPTYTELYALLGENKKPSLVEVGGQKGCYFNGESSASSGVFLPAAGDRFNYCNFAYSRGSIGYYWSSSVNGDNARYLSFSGGGAGMYDCERTYGFSVRCVQDKE